MNGANRQSKLNKYKVRVRREVEHTADLDVEARSLEEAEDVAMATIDSATVAWGEGVVINQRAKAKIVRGT